MIKSLIPNT